MRISASAVLSMAVMPVAFPVSAETPVETARAALIAFTEGVRTGSEALAPVLAPEFQIMRANGVGYDREGYLKTGVGTVSLHPDYVHEEIVATIHGDVMVARYFLRVDETIGEAQVQRRAPRLTVFRMINGRWRVVAHANFGATQ